MMPVERARRIGELKQRLEMLRPLSTDALEAVRRHLDVELTFTSNAIEGNTLTLQETALVIEKGITVGGKSLSEHLEAQDHFAAVQLMRELAGRSTPIGIGDVNELHRRIVLRSRPEIAGVYSRYPRRVAGSSVVFPNPARIPDLMEDFGRWLEAAAPSVETAAEAHLRLVTIHPYADGNGRVARLVLNLVLVRTGLPPIPIRPVDRSRYLAAVEAAQLGHGRADYDDFIAGRVVETLEAYLALVSEALPAIPPPGA